MEKKTKSCCPSSKFDRINELPWNVVDNILVHLPLRIAVRTSILSKSWRYKWITLSKLEFCLSDFFYPFKEEKKTKNLIYGILLRHHGEIENFKLHFVGNLDSYDLDQWLLFLSTKNIRKFDFANIPVSQNGNKLHFCLFSWQQLDCLELFNCILDLPLTFKGFKNLRGLKLGFMSVRDEELGSLIQSCPVLEEVDLVNIQGLSSLKIHAPKLKSLNLHCFLDDISIESCPVLELISIRWSNETSAKQPRMVCNLVRVLGGLSNLKRLEIYNSFVEYLAVGEVPEKLPTSYNHLKYLDLTFHSFYKLDEIQVAFSILRSSPSLYNFTSILRNTLIPVTWKFKLF